MTDSTKTKKRTINRNSFYLDFIDLCVRNNYKKRTHKNAFIENNCKGMFFSANRLFFIFSSNKKIDFNFQSKWFFSLWSN